MWVTKIQLRTELCSLLFDRVRVWLSDRPNLINLRMELIFKHTHTINCANKEWVIMSWTTKRIQKSNPFNAKTDLMNHLSRLVEQMNKIAILNDSIKWKWNSSKPQIISLITKRIRFTISLEFWGVRLDRFK